MQSAWGSPVTYHWPSLVHYAKRKYGDLRPEPTYIDEIPTMTEQNAMTECTTFSEPPLVSTLPSTVPSLDLPPHQTTLFTLPNSDNEEVNIYTELAVSQKVRLSELWRGLIRLQKEIDYSMETSITTSCLMPNDIWIKLHAATTFSTSSQKRKIVSSPRKSSNRSSKSKNTINQEPKRMTRERKKISEFQKWDELRLQADFKANKRRKENREKAKKKAIM
jgi:hypothetical protein